MFDLHSYALFLAAGIVLVITPGPDTILVLSRTLASGTVAGLWTLVGTQTGNIVHALLAGIGVSTLILLFPIAFQTLKIAGIVYLVYLAIHTWRAPAKLELTQGGGAGRGHARRWFRQGLGNNLANPKVIVFFVALFPQFVRPEAGSLALQSLVLGATIAALSFIWIGGLAIVVGRVRSLAASNASFLRVANRVAAVTFLGLAARLAVTAQPA